MKSKKKAIIIGSGAGGLATSIRLAKKGYSVSVFEANAYPGGKITVIEGKGYRFDAGPSLFTLPHLVTDLFELFNEDSSKHFNFYKKQVACHYFWEDGTTLKAFTDKEKFSHEVEKQIGVKDTVVNNYLKNSAEVYDATYDLFLESSLHKLGTYLKPAVITALANMSKMHLLSTLHQVNKAKLKHPKLVQLFDRFATYNGSSPYQTPGVMSIIPHLEHNLGSYYPIGGMHSITTSLFGLATRHGVDFHFNHRVDKILVEEDTVKGISTNKQEYLADVVVSNMDVVPTYRSLMPFAKQPKKVLEQARSSSALIFYWGIKKQFPQLDLHNIFFSKDYEEEFNTIFNEQSVCDDPTIYLNISSKEDQLDAPKGCENWFVMINVPANTGQDWDKITKRLRENILKRLTKQLNTNIEALIEFEDTLDPRTIESRTSSFKGALYGAASNNKWSAFLRHPNFSKQYKNLYFCGGSVHPGGGVPLALLSAKITADLIA